MSIEKTKTIINPFKIVTRTIMRFYLVLYIVAIVTGLIASVMILNDILTKPQVNETANINGPSNLITPEEQAVNTKLSTLETSQKNLSYQNVQSPRPNPFTE